MREVSAGPRVLLSTPTPVGPLWFFLFRNLYGVLFCRVKHKVIDTSAEIRTIFAALQAGLRPGLGIGQGNLENWGRACNDVIHERVEQRGGVGVAPVSRGQGIRTNEHFPLSGFSLHQRSDV